MKILAIETTGLYASVALLTAEADGSEWEIHEKQGDRKFSHLQRVIPMVDELLSECELSIGDVTHIAVSLGPGSFTGIRIGIATAKAMAQALNLPVVGVPSLKALARNAGEFPGLICPVLDARRSQVYCGGYIKQGRQYASVIEDKARGMDEFLELVQAYCESNPVEVLFLGDDYENHQRAKSVAEEAFEMLKGYQGDGDLAAATDYHHIKPVYLRQAEAQRKLEERRLSEEGRQSE